MRQTQKKRLRTMTGSVVSDKMDKTIVVLVRHRVRESTYKKYIARLKTYRAHDPNNACKMGDKVEIVESRPLSRTKHWRVKRVIEKAIEV